MDENIQDVASLIDRPAEVMPFALEGHKHLVHVPCVARVGTSATEVVGIVLPKRAIPLPDGFIGHGHPAGKSRFFDIPIIEICDRTLANTASQRCADVQPPWPVAPLTPRLAPARR